MVIDQTVINIGTNSGSPTTLYENTSSTDVIINNLLTVSKYNDFPTSETEKLTASDGFDYDYFGQVVAMSGDGNSVIVGASSDDISSNTSQGSAYIYKYNSGTSSWDETKITASDGVSYDYFGYSVAMSADGNSVIVGSYDDFSISRPGSAYIYKYNSATLSWDETKITASDGAADDYFGRSVAMSDDGNSVIVGAHKDDISSNSDQGSAYIYKYNSATLSWDETKLTASNGAAEDWFGTSVAMSGDGNSVIVGAIGDDDSAPSGGAAYIYKYNSGTDSWDQTKLTASDGGFNEQFGKSVSMSSDGNSVIVGAFQDTISFTGQGSAYIYKYNSGTDSWDQTKLTAPDGGAYDLFGSSVAMSADGNSVIVGAYGDDISSNNEQGSAYICKYNSGTSSWDQTKLTVGAASDLFGISVSISNDGNSVIVGAFGDDISSNTDQGSAYIFQSTDNNDITIIKEDENANDYTLINQSYSNNSNQIITKDNRIILKPNEKIKGYGSSPDSNVVITTIVQE